MSFAFQDLWSSPEQVEGMGSETDIKTHFREMFRGAKPLTSTGNFIQNYDQGVVEIKHWRSWWAARGGSYAFLNRMEIEAYQILTHYQSPTMADIPEAKERSDKQVADTKEAFAEFADDAGNFLKGAGVGGVLGIVGVIAVLILISR